MSYYIGLSVLSNTQKCGNKSSNPEAKRILSSLENRVIKDTDITREPGGRPYFPDKKSDFNISHSGKITAVAHVQGYGLRVGCDIERVRERKNAEKIAQEYYSKSEYDYLFSSGSFCIIKFFEIWTLKECYIKLRGLSVLDMASIPSFIESPEQTLSFKSDVSLPLFFRLYELTCDDNERYILASVIEGETQLLPEIRLFSSSALACKIRAEIKAAPNPAQTVSPNI